MMLSVLMTFGLAAFAAGEKDTAPKYTLTFDKTTKAVQTGGKGTFSLQIKAADGFKVSAEAPLEIKLAPRGIELDKQQLRHKDAKDTKSTAPEFDIAFRAKQPGAQGIGVDASFYICDEKMCEKMTAKVDVPIDVKQ